MESERTSKRFAIAACCYAVYGLQGFIPLSTATVAFAFPMILGVICSATVVVAMFGVVKSGPSWARILAIVLAIPPIFMVATLVWGMFGSVTIFTLITSAS